MNLEDYKSAYKTAEEKISLILSINKKARNDDLYCLYLVYKVFHNVELPYEELKGLPVFETYRRTRAKIQNEDKIYLPDESTQIHRGIKEQGTLAYVRGE